MDLPAPVSPVTTFNPPRKFYINSIDDGVVLNRKLFQHEAQFKTKTLSHVFNSARHCEQGEATKNPAWINQDEVKKNLFVNYFISIAA
jgi:hypothetical protein